MEKEILENEVLLGLVVAYLIFAIQVVGYEILSFSQIRDYLKEIKKIGLEQTHLYLDNKFNYRLTEKDLFFVDEYLKNAENYMKNYNKYMESSEKFLQHAEKYTLQMGENLVFFIITYLLIIFFDYTKFYGFNLSESAKITFNLLLIPILILAPVDKILIVKSRKELSNININIKKIEERIKKIEIEILGSEKGHKQ